MKIDSLEALDRHEKDIASGVSAAQDFTWTAQ